MDSLAHCLVCYEVAQYRHYLVVGGHLAVCGQLETFLKTSSSTQQLQHWLGFTANVHNAARLLPKKALHKATCVCEGTAATQW